MEDNCPPTPLHVRTGRNSKSPNQVSVSSPDSDGMKSPSGRLSPDSRCVICLGKLQKKSFTDSCLHQFCFQCLVQWSKVKPECPLCKQPFKSIIHNVRSNFDYDQYHVVRREPGYVVSGLLRSYDFDFLPVDRRLRYRSTMRREYFTELAVSFLNRTRTNYQVPTFVPTPPTLHIPPATRFGPAPDWRGNIRSSDFRKNIYEHDLWVQDMADVTGRYRECTPQFYRENPAQIHRIIPWLVREINALISDESSGTCVLDRIITLLPQCPIRSRVFKATLEPYFGNNTEHFIHEFHTFARSVYDISGFDQNAVYEPNPNYSHEVQEISSSNDDSEVEVIGTLNQKSSSSSTRSRQYNFRKSTKNSGEASASSSEPLPGPSGINSLRGTETIEVGESDNDDIKIIEYVKPEPEVVTLSSGDEDAPTASDKTRSRPLKKRPYKERLSDDSLSECSTTCNKQYKSCIKKSKRLKNSGKSIGHEQGTKEKSRMKHNRCASSSSSSSKSFVSVDERKDNRYGSSTSYYSSSSTSIKDDTSSNENEPLSKIRKRSLSEKHHKKDKKSKNVNKEGKNSSEHGESGSGHVPAKKSKIKSCVVVPNSNQSRNESVDGSPDYSSHSSTANYSVNPRQDDSSLMSYWSLVLNKDSDNPWTRKHSKERNGGHGSSKRSKQDQECGDGKATVSIRKEKSKKVLNNDDSSVEMVMNAKSKHFKSSLFSVKSETSVQDFCEKRTNVNSEDDEDDDESGQNPSASTSSFSSYNNNNNNNKKKSSSTINCNKSKSNNNIIDIFENSNSSLEVTNRFM